MNGFEWDNKMTERVTFNMDNPFEDEKFMRKVLTGRGMGRA